MPLVTTEIILEELRSRILAGYPLMALRTWEEARWEQLLAEVCLEMERGLFVWSSTHGWQPSLSDDDHDRSDPQTSLAAIERFPAEHVFLLKDFHPYLKQPAVVRQLRDLLPRLIARQQTVLLMDPYGELPLELAKSGLSLALPLPLYDDFRSALDDVLAELQAQRVEPLELSSDDEDRLIKAVLGLTLEEGCHAWRRALAQQTGLTDGALNTLISEKRTLAAASDLLEFYDLDTAVDDVGGLDELKDWLRNRAKAYTPAAREQGIPLPKGALLLGVQGCGKSLTARAAARMLAFPLVRLDIAALLSSGRGQSEKNLREVLHLVESIAPAVLWLDEMEKGFAGVDGDSFGDATMARIVGSFLMWMQDLRKPVFVIATANSIQNLPPEMLRRGRFDELFFVDLPNYAERLHILRIHLTKRGWKPERFRCEELAERTDGFSGAELEQLVSAAIIDAFGRGQVVSDDDLDRTRRSLVPLSVTMQDKIFALRQWAQDRCRRATSDNRVSQMLDAEERLQQLSAAEDSLEIAGLPAWTQLAQAGQLKAAIVEFIRQTGDVLITDVLHEFESFADVRGELGLNLRNNPNTVLWTGMSQEFCAAVVDLVAARRLYLHPTDAARYAAQSATLPFPVLAEPAEERLQRPAWLPIALRSGPHPVHAAKLARVGRIQLATKAT